MFSCGQALLRKCDPRPRLKTTTRTPRSLQCRQRKARARRIFHGWWRSGASPWGGQTRSRSGDVVFGASGGLRLHLTGFRVNIRLSSRSSRDRWGSAPASPGSMCRGGRASSRTGARFASLGWPGGRKMVSGRPSPSHTMCSPPVLRSTILRIVSAPFAPRLMPAVRPPFERLAAVRW